MCAKFSEKDIDRLITKYRYENSENDFTRLSPTHEATLTDIVRAGRYKDVIHLSRLSENLLHLGKLADDPKRNMEYYAVTIIAFSSRAAIDGGMMPEAALDLSDVLLQGLSKLKTVDEIEDYTLFAVASFAKAVSETRKKANPYVIEQSKVYIDRNIFRNILVADVASFVGLSPEYLGRLFKSVQGMTLHNYIQREKIEAACNILRFSDRSISDIAIAIGFASHSNFGQVFRKWKGMSPTEYRNQYREIQYSEPNTVPRL